MRCIVIGAGNAGRPVARILNYIGHQVLITDQKSIGEFAPKYQRILLQMENEGVNLSLGSDAPDSMDGIDSVYISPNIPQNSEIRGLIERNKIKVIEHRKISHIIDELIEMDIIGVTGTLGKTSTTHIISNIFESAGYKVWKCSSRHGNLLSEVIIDGIINNYHREYDIAVFELPHGTSRLMSEVKLKTGVLTNIYPEHLDEFEDSLEKYAQRKLFIAGSSEILISTPHCRDYLEPLRKDVIYYCSQSECNISGKLDNNQITVNYNLSSYKSKFHREKYSGQFQTDFKLKGYYFENSLAGAAVALTYGLDDKYIKDGLSKFSGISGHLEYLGKFCGRDVHFDAAFVPEGLISTLEQFKNNKLIVLVDNPDTTTIRDKYKIGEVLGHYADIIISSGFNETLGGVNMDAAQEVLDGVDNPDCQLIAVKDMIIAGETSIKVSKPGETIIHVGPGAITNYDDLKEKMTRGIEQGCLNTINK
ncbi:MAG: UDP-N-acetylmuramoyl-L-alanine--D-glutamate ligase [Methanobacterium sp.]|nr:UDP-N-acetylmuramoyl-L-alanine--D-glutamate ligase [Methanobacterium sp.]